MKISKNFFYLIIYFIFVFSFFVPATNGARIFFDPSNGTYIENCSFQIDIMIDTKGKEISTAGIAIINNDKYQIQNFSYSGGIFASYTTPANGVSKYEKFKGKEFFYIMGTNAGTNKFNGIGKFGSIKIKANSGIKNLELNFYVIVGMGGDDSNIVVYSGGKSIDIISDYTNGNYILEDGICTQEDENIIFGEVTLEKNSAIKNKDINEIILYQNSKILFWLSKNRNIIIFCGILLFISGMVMRKKMKKVNDKIDYKN